MRTINEIIVHCTATPAGRPVTVTEINAWHLARGWSGIGYHRVIGLKGERWQGRPLDKIGAHCEGHNSSTIGVVYVGGVLSDGRTPADTRTPAQKDALLAEILALRDRFDIRKISGHNEYAAKACPSFDASAEYDSYFEGGRGIAGTVDPLLRRGDAGPAVLAWADDLAAYRKLIGHQWPLRPTAVFDQDLEMVTRWFQKERGILVDGKVGPQTRMEMERALAGVGPYSALFS
ncbi:N-acetylmuramoyl-L-alanine amidase [Pseudorhizobium halotolerans]|uniref:N-acetylmuramoyl-L-alanine amidase n=1 Tax=Pseudorhizobium halotolerans TaxID=1233081 RepID=A0ABM8PYT7_9HYPH|nr:peptidoglycan-binding domain-containing protein [Pseudorhizobium halotolerans]CAD7055361.1 N-acetylmuramoyl-L-alanine amidase [Pseudorhizobium halotolerans]